MRSGIGDEHELEAAEPVRRMYAVSVDAPFDTVLIAEGVPVNHGRSWPGHGGRFMAAEPLLTATSPSTCPRKRCFPSR